MSPSLVCSDTLSERSNTSSPSLTHHPSDILPMTPTALSFEPATTATASQDLSALSWRDLSSAPARWKLPSPSHPPRGLAPSRTGERLTASTTGIGPLSNNLAVPARAHGRVGSPFDLSRSPAIHSNGPNDLGTLDRHPSPSYAAFLLRRSRVVKVRRDPNATFLTLRSVFDSLGDANQADHPSLGSPLSMWTLNDLSALDEVWIVFPSHHDACLLLSLSLPSFSVFPALETDLEPFEKFRRVDVFSKLPPLPVIQPERKSHKLRMSISTPDLHDRIFIGQSSVDPQSSSQTDKFTISSNPPNPRTTFRIGDWICNSVTCAAHNFGRNLTCRGCGCPRSEGQVSSLNRQTLGMSSARLPTSPRFANAATGAAPFYPGSSIPSSPHYPNMQPRYPLTTQPGTGVKPASPSHPLLTPSGRSFSVGGKVQNISSDPAMPCVMYWPDNEPFPEQGQIRPSNLSGVPQPPILNTGNRGPIEHQPGDWICQKCNYLNWRRRKVCQTCYPYAEGNGDSISAAVQSERINLLTSLLAQNQLPLRNPSSGVDAPRRNTTTQVQHTRPPETPSVFSRSQTDFRTPMRYPSESQFIYETSGPHRQAMFPGMQDLEDALLVGEPAPLLPSFLQDIVQSPTLSPTSSSSADLSVEEYEDLAPSPRTGRDRAVARDDSGSNFHLGNIWRLNDEETTSVAGIALPHHEDLVGSRKNSQEILRRQSP